MSLLDELCGELDVDQASRPELEVEIWVLTGRDALSLDARLHRPNRTHPIGREALGPDPGSSRGEEPGGQCLVARQRAALG